jgi:hypothetical protein
VYMHHTYSMYPSLDLNRPVSGERFETQGPGARLRAHQRGAWFRKGLRVVCLWPGVALQAHACMPDDVHVATRQIDFVPNHLAVDHPWTKEAPELLVQGSDNSRNEQPQNFFKVRAVSLRLALGVGVSGWGRRCPTRLDCHGCARTSTSTTDLWRRGALCGLAVWPCGVGVLGAGSASRWATRCLRTARTCITTAGKTRCRSTTATPKRARR